MSWHAIGSPIAPVKPRSMASSNKEVGYHPMGAPTCLRKKRWVKPDWNATQHCVKAHCCEHDDKLREGWAFRVGTWNVDSITGRVGELEEVLTNRRI